jgi:branched-chain amino acid aminotransferase
MPLSSSERPAAASTDLCWVDGALRPIRQAVARADDSAFCEGRGCYTSVRIASGRARFEARHVERLQRGAKALRLGEIRASAIRRALEELAAAALPAGEGVIRLQLSCDGEGATHLVGVARDLGVDPAQWTAISVELPQRGAATVGAEKTTSRAALALAAQDARAAGADEALLVDAAGCLIEGARSNLFVATRDGALCTPPLASGAVAGIAREVALERIAGIAEREIARRELLDAAELIAVNSVRGARPVVRLDGRNVADGQPGSWSARLARALEIDD